MAKMTYLHGKPITECPPDLLRRAAAEQARRRHTSQESFDTDGFLTQAVQGLTAQLYEQQAAINEAGGTSAFRVLVDEAGEVVSEKIDSGGWVNSASGGGFYAAPSWRLCKADRARFGRYSIPIAGKSGRSRVQDQLGLREEFRAVKAVAAIVGSGTGLSGVATCRVAVLRLDQMAEG